MTKQKRNGLKAFFGVFVFGSIWAPLGVLQAEVWSESNNFSRIVLHEFCGDPEKEPLKSQLGNDPCFCWNQFAGDPDNDDDAMMCKIGNKTKSTPNYFGGSLRRNVVLEHMFKVLYGEVGGDDWCWEFKDDGRCNRWIPYKGNNDDKTEARVIGHFVAAIVGEAKCLDAKLGGGEEWHKGTYALSGIDFSFLDNGDLRDRFDEGCRINYEMVWKAKKIKAGGQR